MRRITTYQDIESAREAGELSSGDETLLKNCLAGMGTTLNGVNRPGSAMPECVVHAEVLRYLIAGGCDARRTGDYGVRLSGAYIAGEIGLDFATARGALMLYWCNIPQGISAPGARFEVLGLNGSLISHLYAQGLTVRGDVFLRDGFQATGTVSLVGAEIGGQLECDRGRFSNPKGYALHAQGMTAGGSILLRNGFHASGEVSLMGAEIGGQLVCIGGRFDNPTGKALNAQGLTVNGHVFLTDGFHATGEVSLASAKIGGQLECQKGRFDNPMEFALNTQGSNIKGSVFLRDQFHATGNVSLARADIGGQLECQDGRFDNPKGKALYAQGMTIKGNVLLRDGFRATGEVSLLGAKIGGSFECSNGHFQNPDGVAINAQDVVAKSLFWRNIPPINGTVILEGAKVESLADDAASWWNTERYSLDGFSYKRIFGRTDAAMRLDWVQKGEKGKEVFYPQPYTQLATALHDMGHDADRRIVMIEKEKAQRKFDRRILRSTRRVLRDAARLSRNPTQEGRVGLSRLINNEPEFNNELIVQNHKKYGLLHTLAPGPEGSAPTQFDWRVENAKAGFREEVFWQIARLRTRIFWNHFLDRLPRWLAGYGYQPFRFLWALALLWLLAFGAAFMAWHSGDFAPNSDIILSTTDWQKLAEDADQMNPAETWSNETGKGRDYESFSAAAYAFDIVVPIVKLGQEAAWAPSTTRGPWGWHLWWARWVFTVFGWIITAVGAAAITGIIRKD